MQKNKKTNSNTTSFLPGVVNPKLIYTPHSRRQVKLRKARVIYVIRPHPRRRYYGIYRFYYTRIFWRTVFRVHTRARM